MTKGDYRMLNQRLYGIISQSFAFMTTKCYELINSHQVTIQKLVQSNVETLAYQKQLVEDSSQLIEVASSKVFKIVFDINNMETKHAKFMNSFQTIFDNNVSKVNKVILSFGLHFKMKENHCLDIDLEYKEMMMIITLRFLIQFSLYRQVLLMKTW